MGFPITLKFRDPGYLPTDPNIAYQDWMDLNTIISNGMQDMLGKQLSLYYAALYFLKTVDHPQQIHKPY